ncbi:MAG TPA: hypothetical protein VGA74_00135 [Actinomycetota bacterium]
MFVQNGSAIFVAVLADQAFGELWVTTLSFPFTIAYVSRLTEELEAEIVRQAEAADRRVVLTKQLAQLADERSKLLHAFYANAIPLDLLKAEQDRITAVEHMARSVVGDNGGRRRGLAERPSNHHPAGRQPPRRVPQGAAVGAATLQ